MGLEKGSEALWNFRDDLPYRDGNYSYKLKFTNIIENLNSQIEIKFFIWLEDINLMLKILVI